MSFWSFGLSTPRKQEKNAKSNSVSVETLCELRCQACPLDKLEKSLKHPKMKPTGSKHPLIYVIGEAPGKEESLQGIQFVGPSGRLLRESIPDDWADKIRWNNTIRCQPPANRNPTWTEVECCRTFQVEDIEETKPFAIFGIGGVPLNWATNDDGIYKWRGRYLPVRVGSHVCWFFPMLHPAGLLRQRRKSRSGGIIKSEAEHTFIRDLKRAFKLVTQLPQAKVVDPYAASLGATGAKADITLAQNSQRRPTGSYGAANGSINGYPKPIIDPVDPAKTFKGVEYVTGRDKGDLKKVIGWLKYLVDKPSIALDIETASLERKIDRQTRPYSQGAKIVTIAIAAGSKSFAFPLRHKEAGWTSVELSELERRLTKFLRLAKGVKVAHNLSYELEWLGYFLGKEIIYAGQWGDSMGQAYVLDERRGMLNLDILTLQHLGFPLKSLMNLDKSDLDNEPLEMVLTYNALDSLFEHRLYLKQKNILKQEGLWEVYLNHIPPVQATVLTQLFGNKIDFKLVKSLGDKYTADIERLAAQITNSKIIAKFEKWKGSKFNPASATDVIKLFRDVLERPEGWQEDDSGKKRYSADDEVLKKMDLPVARWIQEYRAALGHRSKYIEPLYPKTGECIFPDGRIHSNIHVFFTKSGRTSSSFVNSQFWPRDDPYRELRGEFVAEDDCIMVAADQGQVEARVIAMASKDKRYCQYIWDRHDVHMDWTERLAYAYPARIGGKKFIKDKDVMKQFRTDVKNQWTFPLFFGCNSYSAARYLSMPIEIVDPMVDKFWQEFSGVKAWQEELEDFYRRKGYVECMTGRRRRAPISHNELINSPIQGSASDITISAYCRLSKAAYDLDMWHFQARQEIHDELVFHLPRKTFDRDLEFVIDHLLDCAHFPWIIVPLAVECRMGSNWYDMKEIGTFYSDDLGKLDRRACGF